LRNVSEKRVVYIGHINSLAVNSDFRRRGVAVTLMNVMHRQLVDTYDVDIVSLHVRASNRAALKLYESSNYYCAEVLKGYYEDGESALLLRARGLRRRVRVRDGDGDGHRDKDGDGGVDC